MKIVNGVVVVLATLTLILGGAGTSQAAMTVAPYVSGAGSTEWTNTEAAVGSWSFQCNNPVSGINWAGVRINGLGAPTVGDFSGWDYWTKSNSTQGGLAFHGINMSMLLDHPSVDNIVIGGVDYGYDLMLNIMPHNMMGDDAIHGDVWVKLASTESYAYQVFAWSATGAYLGGDDLSTAATGGNTWSEFQDMEYSSWWGINYDFSEAVVKSVLLRTGGGGLAEDVTAYLDDFTINRVPVTVEGGSFSVGAAIPEPATILIWSALATVAGTVYWLRTRK